ncbi:MAG TPA: RsmE family RNA methyltransferase [Candidatus Dormibacteraeota bacterium]|nr:RsmE family RNA methyltransferase [Candidatus Dormibacteraeota bacterium]
MHRFYLPPEHCAGDTLRLDGREAHHALHVLRLKRGELLTVLDGVGNVFMCAVEDCARNVITLSVSLKNFVPALPCSITLLQAVPKGKIIESIIQKSVELGARKIVPVLSERVVTQLDDEDAGNKRDKWQSVAIEAIKQCGAAWLPKVEVPMTIEQFLARKDKFDLSLVGSLQKERRHPREVLRGYEKKHGRLSQNVGAWIGPEGDFTSEELKTIQNSGALPISLGNLVLRVETAAIYCLSILNYELNSVQRPLV